MPTFLVNSRMNPALAARVRRTLGGGSSNKVRSRAKPAAVALLRVVALAFIVGMASLLLIKKQHRVSRVDTARAALLDKLRTYAEPLSEQDRLIVPRAEARLLEASGVYEGDHIAAELTGPGELQSLLRRGAVYVRGPIEEFRTKQFAQLAAAKSRKDSLLLCLLEPPESSAEKVLLKKVYTAYKGAATMDAFTGQVRRLHAAIAGLPVLAPAWAERVRQAPDLASLEKLRKLVRLAPLREVDRAAKAELLISVMDEPKLDDSPSEFDGATHHQVRLEIWDIREDKLLLRQRRPVDPAWISEAKRHHYASGLNGCRYALDVYQAVSPKEEPDADSEEKK